jgi:hypothetical protein
MALADVPEIWITRYLSSTHAGPDYKCVLLRTRDIRGIQNDIGHAVLVAQPLRRSRIKKCKVDFAAVLLAKVFKRPIGNKPINQLQLTSGDQSLDECDRHAQNISGTFPGDCGLF